MGRAADKVVDGALAAERQAAPWIQSFARMGYASKGIVYGLIGVLALRAALGAGRATDTHGALRALVEPPFGRILLAGVAVGLVGYGLWGLYQGIRNPERDSPTIRISRLVTGLIHAGLAVTAARLAFAGRPSGAAAEPAGEPTRELTAEALQQPVGVWLVSAIGGALIAHALWQFYLAATAQLDEHLDMSAVPASRRSWLLRIARVGVAARGLVFLVIGAFLVRAALRYDPMEARDFAGALNAIEQQPFGPWLLALVAAGLFAFGIYEIIRARYRIIQPRHALPKTQIRLKRA